MQLTSSNSTTSSLMSSWPKKRKNRTYGSQSYDRSQVSHQLDTALFVQAYEADLVRGAQAAAAAKSLEVRAAGNDGKQGHVGDGLILWNPRAEQLMPEQSLEELVTLRQSPDSALSSRSRGHGVWVDRYAAC